MLKQAFAGEAYEQGDLVFCDELGRPIYPGDLTARFRKLRKASGLPSGSLHVLRHTAATLMLLEGIPLNVVAARLGDDPTTVLATYAHLLPQSDELAQPGRSPRFSPRVSTSLASAPQTRMVAR